MDRALLKDRMVAAVVCGLSGRRAAERLGVSPASAIRWRTLVFAHGMSAGMDTAEEDVLAYMSFPPQHRTKLDSTNPLERLNGEIKWRASVVGIFPNQDAITRLVGAPLLEQNDEWAVQRGRCMTLESDAQSSDDPNVALPAMAT